MTTTPQRAFLFDMDGTIVDNMAFHTSSWVTFFERRGQAIDADEFFRATAGRQGGEIIRTYLGEGLGDEEVAALNHEKESVYRELYAPHLKAVDGFDKLIQQAKANGVKLAVGTAAPPANVAFTLDGLGLRAHFDAIVGAADVARGKPHPDVFLKAAELCGVAPEHCIVFEDAPLGVEAARRAGMRCIVLTTTLPAASFAGFDNVIAIVRDFSELKAEPLFA
ncbi:HAD family phosphatase [Massilia sp. BSC265]|uniref:HAD family hydrolase n=1 Tax=Massilia sp. BSC265 TaxID=1549812 RepID=UPI0004E8800F|nr:HAD family phosphatase [Massilia sp. BSC265]KFI07790.1 beta-phosphoglucomutase [Massilia sp. BSC265]